MNKSNNKQFKTITQKTLNNSILKRCIILSRNFDDVDKIMGKTINTYSEKI